MKAEDLLQIYKTDPLVLTLSEKLKSEKPMRISLQGLAGSFDALVAASNIQLLGKRSHLFVMHDREEAVFFQNDLQSLLPEKEIMLFPASYKRPYDFDEIENANILHRAEVLSHINAGGANGVVVISFPEALCERVVNKQTLKENTFKASVGEKVDVQFIAELLDTYEFDRSDFVYEPGQYSIRGGIIDIFSFSEDLPFRVELFGNEIESIRLFDPISQLSKESLQELSIVPNVQTKLIKESRESFLEFMPEKSLVWIKDYELVLDVIDRSFRKVSQSYNSILESTSKSKVVLAPDELFETPEGFKQTLEQFSVVEFGRRFILNAEKLKFDTQPQPSFNKNFELLKEDLHQKTALSYTCIVAAEQAKQLERLKTIFDEIDPLLRFHSLNTGLREGFIDPQMKIACYTDHQIFERYHRAKTKEKFSKSKALTLKELHTLQPGDFVTHIDHGIGRFAGLEKVEVSGKMQEAIRLVYRDDDLLYVSIHSLHKISRYTGKEGTPPIMSKLGSPEWENKKSKAKKKVKDIAHQLISLYAKRKTAPGFAFSKDGVYQTELESSFIYDDTPDQATATADVKADMEQPHPMDRLVCGDVGFGKTEVAVRAAFKAVNDGKQVAVLVPTTILALQHFRTFSERLSEFPVTVDYINRFKSTTQIKASLKNLAEGKTDMIIGTHRIVSKDVKFKNLGLLIIDEEQKFGVAVKDKLKELRVNIDVLTLTATPIPRTLHFSLMGARDLSVIQTPPPNRQPVTTEIHTFNEEVIRDAVVKELERGGQVFFVHNRISDIENIANTILKLVPDAKVGIAHGQMEGPKLEKLMLNFIEGHFDVLVSTNIIESGLDIPNANTIIINRAHMFGLSDIHQMRGRVGRSNRKAYCYLLTPPASVLTSDARKRLATLEEFSELGDGFKVAMRDLDIRGAGNLLGGEQSGFINDLGFDTYHKILDEAVQELKENEFKELFQNSLIEIAKKIVTDCTVETDLELLIPDSYVGNISERLSLYSSLDNIKDEAGLESFQNSLRDRFGPLPNSVQDLIKTVRLRWKAEKLGIEKLNLKAGNMKAYFVSQDNERYYNSDVFGNVIAFVQTHSRMCKLKELNKKLILTVNQVDSVERAMEILDAMAGKLTGSSVP